MIVPPLAVVRRGEGLRTFEPQFVLVDGQSTLDASSVRVLDLSDNEIETCRGLDMYPKLEAIIVPHNTLSMLRHLSPHLTVINVAYNKLERITGLDSLQLLQELDISYNVLDDLSGLLSVTMLRHLRCNGNRISTIQGLEPLRHLETLELKNNLLASTDSIRALSLNVNLKNLKLSGNKVAKQSSYKVTCLHLVPGLCYLDDEKVHSGPLTRSHPGQSRIGLYSSPSKSRLKRSVQPKKKVAPKAVKNVQKKDLPSESRKGKEEERGNAEEEGGPSHLDQSLINALTETDASNKDKDVPKTSADRRAMYREMVAPKNEEEEDTEPAAASRTLPTDEFDFSHQHNGVTSIVVDDSVGARTDHADTHDAPPLSDDPFTIKTLQDIVLTLRTENDVLAEEVKAMWMQVKDMAQETPNQPPPLESQPLNGHIRSHEGPEQQAVRTNGTPPKDYSHPQQQTHVHVPHATTQQPQQNSSLWGGVTTATETTPVHPATNVEPKSTPLRSTAPIHVAPTQLDTEPLPLHVSHNTTSLWGPTMNLQSFQPPKMTPQRFNLSPNSSAASQAMDVSKLVSGIAKTVLDTTNPADQLSPPQPTRVFMASSSTIGSESTKRPPLPSGYSEAAESVISSHFHKSTPARNATAPLFSDIFASSIRGESSESVPTTTPAEPVSNSSYGSYETSRTSSSSSDVRATYRQKLEEARRRLGITPKS